jgi:AcrR family transcriptional regulator
MRNRERTEQRIVEAVERILIRDGWRAIGVNAIAEEANVDKVLIYRYFGGLNELLEAVGRREDLWPEPAELLGEPLEAVGQERSLSELTLAALRGELEGLRTRPLTCKALGWELAEQNGLVERLGSERRARRDELQQELFGDRAAPPYVDHQAFLAILRAAATYLAMAAQGGASADRVGIDLSTEAGWRRLDRTLAAIVRTMLGPAQE